MDAKLTKKLLIGLAILCGLLLIAVIYLALRPTGENNDLELARSQERVKVLEQMQDENNKAIVQNNKYIDSVDLLLENQEDTRTVITNNLRNERNRILNLPLDSAVLLLSGRLSSDNSN